MFIIKFNILTYVHDKILILVVKAVIEKNRCKNRLTRVCFFLLFVLILFEFLRTKLILISRHSFKKDEFSTLVKWTREHISE